MVERLLSDSQYESHVCMVLTSQDSVYKATTLNCHIDLIDRYRKPASQSEACACIAHTF